MGVRRYFADAWARLRYWCREDSLFRRIVVAIVRLVVGLIGLVVSIIVLAYFVFLFIRFTAQMVIAHLILLAIAVVLWIPFSPWQLYKWTTAILEKRRKSRQLETSSPQTLPKASPEILAEDVDALPLPTEAATVTQHAEQCCRAGNWLPGNRLSEVVRTLGLTTRDFELLYHHLRGKGIKIPLVRGAMLNPDVVEYFFTHIGRDGFCDPDTTSRLALLVDHSTPFPVTWRQPFSELEEWPPPHAPRHFRPTIARRTKHYG